MRALACALILLASSTARAGDAPRVVNVKGSDTIGGELGPALAKGFEALHPGAQVKWEALGSKTAFVGLFDASADVGAASRPVNADELGQAQRLGIKLQEFIIAYDGLSIVVHPGNKVPSLTVAQLSDLFAGSITNWREVGGADVPVTLIARPSYSGTRTFFEEKALHVGGAKRTLAANAKIMENNQEITAEVARTPGAISFVGLASVTPSVRLMPLQPSAAARPVKPEPAAIRDGSYPLYRPLFLYTRGAPSGLAADLVRFALSPAGQDIVQAVGFVRLEKALPPPAVGALGEGGEDHSARPPVRIFFPWGGYKLDDTAKHTLAELSASVRNTGERLIIVGNADGNGGSDSNRRMAQARAKAVAGFLRAFGVAGDRLDVKGAGADAPIGSNETRAGRERNRRVDVYIIKPGADDVAKSR
jgi:phosphate transport system substrate-binding protein